MFSYRKEDVAFKPPGLRFPIQTSPKAHGALILDRGTVFFFREVQMGVVAWGRMPVSDWTKRESKPSQDEETESNCIKHCNNEGEKPVDSRDSSEGQNPGKADKTDTHGHP